ncbi:MAG: TOBE domain-containing protein, partial [Alphaproteobacteria bacterium]|nr:TOBE domain-containing protein [Alphaproteobacteria bacterium]
QEEALAISDRICVMQSGRAHQVASPQEVYARPATLFVASFIGAMNLFPDVAVDPGGTIALGSRPAPMPALAGRDRVALAIRPEDVVLDESGDRGGPGLRLDGVVTKITFAGREAIYRVKCDDGLEVMAQIHRPNQRRLAEPGHALSLTLPLDQLHAFATATGQRIELRP